MMNIKSIVLSWPALRQLGIIVIVISGFIFVCESYSFYLYPLALLFIGSRIYALSLLGHEALEMA